MLSVHYPLSLVAAPVIFTLPIRAHLLMTVTSCCAFCALAVDGLSAAERYVEGAKNGESFALLFMDLDNFKVVNDTKGHMEGDKCLGFTGYILLAACRKNDIVCRFGGDEFMILLKDISSKAFVLSMAQRLLVGVMESAICRDCGVTCSIGISFCSALDCSPAEALQRADDALYRAKNEGKDRFYFFDEDAAILH